MGTLIVALLAAFDPEGFFRACIFVIPALVFGLAIFYAQISQLIVPLAVSVTLLIISDPSFNQMPMIETAISIGKFVEIFTYCSLVIITFLNYFIGRKPQNSAFILILFLLHKVKRRKME